MSLAQKIFRIFIYIFLVQMGILGIWASFQFISRDHQYPNGLVHNLVNVDKSILEAAILQDKIGARGVRDLLIYKLLEQNSIDSVEFLDSHHLGGIKDKFKLEGCASIETATICSRANKAYLTSLIPLEYDGNIEGYLKLEKSLKGYADTNKKIFISIGLTAFAIFLINLLTMSMIWSRFLKPQTNKLLRALANEQIDDEIQITEFNQIQDKFLEIINKIKVTEAEKSKLESRMDMLNLATQVAHDIRSPLEVLKGLKDELKGLPESIRRRVLMSINRIEEIAYNLLKTHKGQNISNESEEVNLLKLILGIARDKKIEYKGLSEVNITCEVVNDSYILHSNIHCHTVQRILSNLANNAIESLPDQRGDITFRVEYKNGNNVISISDTGCGISEEKHGSLFQKGFTTKEMGNGLGIYSAKIEIEKLGGSIYFESILGLGTTFFISLPCSGRPIIFPTSIDLNRYNKIIILDDDFSIHELWANKLESFGIPVEKFTSITELLSKYESLPSTCLFLSDFELQDQIVDGISCIEKLSHESHSILITAREEEKEIIKRCQKSGIALLPKELINYIPVEAPVDVGGYFPQIIFIDDDRIIQSGWKLFCSKNNLQLQTFFTVDKFLEASGEVEKDSLIFIDSNLGQGLRGESESKRIFDLGFKNIYMATGYDKESFANIPWIKGVIGKGPEAILKHLRSINRFNYSENRKPL
jgi:signal transduction histidine kinase/FixJ family two-component response regulator